jgi:tetratricopeptide (TPR) repeat protein
VNVAEAEDLVAKGLAALDHDHTHLALVCFERAREIEMSPLVSSSLGFCLAAARGELDRGIELCREAIGEEPDNALHHRNLGRVLLLAGRKDEALLAFRQGLRLGRDEGIIRELDRLGTRKPPVIRALGRNHPLNKWLGIILSRLGFR